MRVRAEGLPRIVHEELGERLGVRDVVEAAAGLLRDIREECEVGRVRADPKGCDRDLTLGDGGH